MQQYATEHYCNLIASFDICIQFNNLITFLLQVKTDCIRNSYSFLITFDFMAFAKFLGEIQKFSKKRSFLTKRSEFFPLRLQISISMKLLKNS